MEEKVLFKVSPKFKLLYELFMPTGKKLKHNIFILFSLILVLILSNLIFSTLADNKEAIGILNFVNVLLIIFIIVLALAIVGYIIMQTLQYKNITYRFYDDYLEYKDTFLNQHTKTIRYDSIKEIEIRRTVLDRMLGFGIIAIYTNAENGPGAGLVIYSVKDPQLVYDKIDSIIHKKIKFENKNDEIVGNVENLEKNKQDSNKSEEDFKKSINNK
jgi:uncharacterized membrane protein YdbT with pleckstrin-like domain